MQLNHHFLFCIFSPWFLFCFDYRGNDFIRPLIIMEQSRTVGVEQLGNMQAVLDRGENVVLLSNHQTEADAQVKRRTVLVCLLFMLW